VFENGNYLSLNFSQTFSVHFLFLFLQWSWTVQSTNRLVRLWKTDIWFPKTKRIFLPHAEKSTPSQHVLGVVSLYESGWIVKLIIKLNLLLLHMPDLHLRGVICSKSDKKTNEKSFTVKDDKNCISKHFSWIESILDELIVVHLVRKYCNK